MFYYIPSLFSSEVAQLKRGYIFLFFFGPKSRRNIPSPTGVLKIDTEQNNTRTDTIRSDVIVAHIPIRNDVTGEDIGRDV